MIPLSVGNIYSDISGRDVISHVEFRTVFPLRQAYHLPPGGPEGSTLLRHSWPGVLQVLSFFFAIGEHNTIVSGNRISEEFSYFFDGDLFRLWNVKVHNHKRHRG